MTADMKNSCHELTAAHKLNIDKADCKGKCTPEQITFRAHRLSKNG